MRRNKTHTAEIIAFALPLMSITDTVLVEETSGRPDLRFVYVE